MSTHSNKRSGRGAGSATARRSSWTAAPADGAWARILGMRAPLAPEGSALWPPWGAVIACTGRPRGQPCALTWTVSCPPGWLPQLRAHSAVAADLIVLPAFLPSTPHGQSAQRRIWRPCQPRQGRAAAAKRCLGRASKALAPCALQHSCLPLLSTPSSLLLLRHNGWDGTACLSCHTLGSSGA